METALSIYLSDMPESEKIQAIRAEFVPMAILLDSITGSSIIQEWENEES